MTADLQNIVRRERPSLKDELSLIPPWAFVLAAIVFVGVPVCFFLFVTRGPQGGTGLILSALFPIVPAVFFAVLVLMIGYVNRDAGRRGMSRTLWTLIVMFVPSAMGFILYFLLRYPVRAQCPKCRATVDPRFNYCPNCRYAFHPTCPQCKLPVGPGDTFCTNCGTQLTAQL